MMRRKINLNTHKLLLLVYSLYRFGLLADNQNLHSFPTRRSSDLAARAARSTRGGLPRGEDPRARRRRHARGSSPRGRDRYSTRLNYSHQINTYAVFFLKKKK